MHERAIFFELMLEDIETNAIFHTVWMRNNTYNFGCSLLWIMLKS